MRWLAGVVLAGLGVACRASTDEPSPPSGCEDGCHWDCLSTAPYMCVNGEVWRQAYGPRPCCRYDDPWPGPGPMCTTGSEPALRCPSMKCEPAGANPNDWCVPVDAGAEAGADALPEASIDDAEGG